MGNCVVKEAVKISTASSLTEGGGRVRVEEAKNVISLSSMSCPPSSSSASSGEDHDGTSCSIVSKRKKSVSFKVGDDGFEQQVTVTGKMKRGSSTSGGAAVRIRVVLTQAELNRILMTARSDYRHTPSAAAEQLGFINVNNTTTRGRRSMRRRRMINDVGAAVDGGWMPALESIPEDH